jgi:hypothetical protein
MLTLTTAIAPGSINKIKVLSVELDGENLVGIVTVSAQGGGGKIYGTYQVSVRDGQSQGVRATAAPLGFSDCVEVFTLATPTAFSDLVTAYTGAIAARNKAAESALVAAGLLPPGAVA